MVIKEFEKYWQNYSDNIESLLIRNISKGTIDLDKTNNEISNFSQKWKSKRNAEGLWLNTLRENNSNKAETFEVKLDNFKLTKEPEHHQSMFAYYLIIVLIGIISVFIVLYMSLSIWKTILIPLLCIMLTSGFVIPFGKGKIQESNRNLISNYMKQVNKQKDLLNIILNN